MMNGLLKLLHIPVKVPCIVPGNRNFKCDIRHFDQIAERIPFFGIYLLEVDDKCPVYPHNERDVG